MPRLSTPRLVGLLLLVGLACISRSERIAQLRAQLVGQPASVMRSCLGDPNSISLPSEGVEEISYRWPLPPQTQPEDFDGGGSWNRERGPWLPPLSTPDRTITDVRAVGKTAEGLDAERRCLEVTQRCIPD